MIAPTKLVLRSIKYTIFSVYMLPVTPLTSARSQNIDTKQGKQ